MRRETSAVRSAAEGNKLSGTLPAALGTLTDLVALCARPPPIPRGGEGPARPRSAESVRPRARAVLRSNLLSNGLTGTIGSWIGSLAKLTGLYARARACTGGTPAAAHAHSRGGYCRGYGSTLRRGGCGATCAVRRLRALCAFVCVCVRLCVCLFVCVLSRQHTCAYTPCGCTRARTWLCVCVCPRAHVCLVCPARAT
jgi:hypothetical protein